MVRVQPCVRGRPPPRRCRADASPAKLRGSRPAASSGCRARRRARLPRTNAAATAPGNC